MEFGTQNLVVFAHPDDETVFFGSLLIAKIGPCADLVCVTDGNFRGRGAERQQQLERACEALRVRKVECLGYRDHPLSHLPVEELGARLRERVVAGGYQAVFTHSAHGEYGSFNHIDVSRAVHAHLSDLVPVYSVADLLVPDFQIDLTAEIHAQKLAILTGIYLGEIGRSWRGMRMPSNEGYVRLDPAESLAIYRLCTEGRLPDASETPRYRALLPLLAQPWRTPASHSGEAH